MSAPLRRRSLSGRLRRLFHRRSQRNARPKTCLMTPDYDEAPQRHLVQAHSQMPLETLKTLCRGNSQGKPAVSPRIAPGNTAAKPNGNTLAPPNSKKPSSGPPQKPNLGNSPKPSSGNSQKLSSGNSHKPYSGISQKPTLGNSQKLNLRNSPKTTSRVSQKPTKVSKTMPARPKSGASSSPVKPAAPAKLGNFFPIVSPLDLFYHTIVAPYDTRLCLRAAGEETGVNQTNIIERKGFFKVGKHLCAKKSSRDNTIGSIDSIDSEEISTEERNKLLEEEDAVAVPCETVDIRERQFIADTVTRTGLTVDGLSAQVEERYFVEDPFKGKKSQKQLELLCQASELKEYHGNVHNDGLAGDGVLSAPPPGVCLNGEVIVTGNESPGSEDLTYIVSYPMGDNQDVPCGTGVTSLSEALAVSVSPGSSSDIMPSPDEEDLSEGNNLSAQIGNAMLSMRRTQDKVNVSGKYSQVVVMHGNERDSEIRSRGPGSPSTSARAVIKTDSAQDISSSQHESQDLELPARSGQYLSFNICGENVYITVGSKKTKIKSCRRKSSDKSFPTCSSKGLCGSEADGKRSGLTSKKKKSKKRLKRIIKSAAKRKDPEKSTKKSVTVADEPCSGVKSTKFSRKNSDTDSDVDEETMKGSGAIELSSNKSGDSSRPQNNDTKDVQSLKGSAFGSTDSGLDMKIFNLSDLKLSDVSLGKCDMYEQSSASISENSKIGDTNNVYERSDTGLENAAKNASEKTTEKKQECMGGDSYGLEEITGGWIVVSKGTVGRRIGHDIVEESHARLFQEESDVLSREEGPLENSFTACCRECVPGNDVESLVDESLVNRTESETFRKGEDSVNLSNSNSTTKIAEDQAVFQLCQMGYVVDEDDCSVAKYGSSDATKILSADQSCPSKIDLVQGILDRPMSVESLDSLCIDTTDPGIPLEDDPKNSTDDVRLKDGVEDDPINSADDVRLKDVVDESGFVDAYALKRAWQAKNKTLKKQMTKYRQRSRQVIQLQQLIGQLDRETAEMRKLLEGLDRQIAALKNEAVEIRCTLSSVCDVSVTDLSRTTEARTLEPACFRRYINIRTPLDAVNLLSAIRNRVKALNELEILTYRRQLVLHHVLPASTQERLPAAKRVLRAAHKGSKAKKTEESSSKKGNIVIEVVSPKVESEEATPSWSEEVTNTDSPVTTSVPLSDSVEGETTPSIALNTLNI